MQRVSADGRCRCTEKQERQYRSPRQQQLELLRDGVISMTWSFRYLAFTSLWISEEGAVVDDRVEGG